MISLYKEIMIWQRLSEASAKRYSCLQDFRTNLFAVQSADFFHLPLEESQFRGFERQFVELFIEAPVAERCEWFATLEEAILAHDQTFSEA